jgi:hypothetical protein
MAAMPPDGGARAAPGRLGAAAYVAGGLLALSLALNAYLVVSARPAPTTANLAVGPLGLWAGLVRQSADAARTAAIAAPGSPQTRAASATWALATGLLAGMAPTLEADRVPGVAAVENAFWVANDTLPSATAPRAARRRAVAFVLVAGRVLGTLARRPDAGGVSRAFAALARAGADLGQ